MKQNAQEFLEAMWKKAERKEENLRLAEELSRMPEKQGVESFLWDIFCGIGVRQMFAGMADILLVSFCIAVLFLFFCLRMVGVGWITAYGAVFTSAPALYAAVFYLSIVKERQNETYDQLMSCKYTFFHLMTARMFFSSLLGLGCNLVYVLILGMECQADIPRLLAAAFASLMFFSLLLVLGIEKGRRIGWGVAVSGSWIVGNLLLLGTVSNWYMKMLEKVPTLLLAAAGIVAAVAYIRHLSALCGQTFRKEYTNAAN